MPSRRAELAELSEQITAMREQLAALTERLEEIGAATED
jgi:ubiquinone biosynthesis protein UbiJ